MFDICFSSRAPYLDNMQCMLMPQSHKQKKIYITMVKMYKKYTRRNREHQNCLF